MNPLVEYVLIFGLGPTELLVILLIIVVLFGATKIPQLARGLGKGINEFKRGLKDTDDDEMKEIEEKKDKDPEEKQGG